MSKKRLNIGLVCSSQADLAKHLSALTVIGEVHFLSPLETKMAYDVVILPDVGVNPTLTCFRHGNYIGLPSESMCPLIELFRLYALPYYIERQVSVVAMGSSTAIIWDILKGNAVSVRGKPALLKTQNRAVIVRQTDEHDHVTGFEAPGFYGVPGFEDKEMLISTVLREIRAGLDNSDSEKPAGMLVPKDPDDGEPPMEGANSW